MDKTRLKTNSILDRKFKYTLEFIQGLGQVWARLKKVMGLPQCN